MKWERRIAGLVLVLSLILVIHGFWSSRRDKLEIPVVAEIGEVFHSVYYASVDGEHLAPEFRAGIPTVTQLLSDLIEGPVLTSLVGIIPNDVRVLGYRRQTSLIFVNFSHHLVSNHPGGSRAELLTVYAIVNTLVEMPGIERVQILVENERLETLVGHIYIWEPLEKDHTILGSFLI